MANTAALTASISCASSRFRFRSTHGASEVAGSFNPVRFDAEAWVKAARDAGMKYFVITAKNTYDGFAMWPTRVNRFNIVDATPWKRDPMKELRAACDKYGLKFGFYYSHAFADWSG